MKNSFNNDCEVNVLQSCNSSILQNVCYKMNSLNRISFNSLFNLNYLHIKTSLLQKSLGKSKKDHWQDD